MTDDDLELDLSELSSAEDFLDYFGIAFEPAVVHVNRLHILQRFHDYLAEIDLEPADAGARKRLYAERLATAYQDFVQSDARTERVFRIFRGHRPRQVAIALTDLTGASGDAAEV